ncbi:uncharacterized membrane protein YhaH (DUF805 family) [Glaciihabitans tibetensis]|uniref:Uncharacterized membrane protein YhaH (DUF805 family) n=1 Tax=Glaciihabitans tibetensis TaxID=1266600 RepID=A0A2T0VH08_9MICO|nr:DUF805 domain-containing protein [Glaciihabitans tibetensis]PRY69508.1 uncharacterized membrane protein YhaH (DUF805 family) [Glaciihabitans tibetensis]
MNFGQAIASVFSNYAQFGGFATRSEYWWWTLFSTIVSLVLSVIDVAINPESSVEVLATLWALVVFLPSLAVAVRRLRDAGYGWPMLFWGLVPIVGAIVLIVLWCQPTRISAPAVYDPYNV